MDTLPAASADLEAGGRGNANSLASRRGRWANVSEFGALDILVNCVGTHIELTAAALSAAGNA